MTVLESRTFLNDATSTGYSDPMDNHHGDDLTICVSGTFTATIKMEGKQGGTWYDLTLEDLSTGDKATEIDAAGIFSVVAPQGFEQIRCNLKTISTGSVTVTGRLCAR